MKFNSLCLAFLSLVLLQLFSCKRNALEDFDIAKGTPVTVSAGGLRGNIQRDNEKIILQVGLGLSAPATKAFQINLSLNMDTVNTLIEKNTLSNTVALPVLSIKLPNVAEVTYGVDSAFFNVEVSVTALEQFYGKKVALAVSLDDPTKGNQASKIKRTTLIVLDTRDLVKQEEIHYLSIKNGGGGVLKVTKGENYKVTSAGVTISLDVLLAGIPGSAFSIKTTVNTDTVASLVANKVLPQGTLPLAKGKYLLDSVINFPANKTQATYELNIPWSTMDQNLNNSTALTIRLSSSNKHVLHPVNSVVVVLIDPSVSLDNNSFITGNGTGLKAEYFKGTQTINEGGRLPDLVRIDPQINFVGWQPFPEQDDNWSSRWTGEFLAPVRGEYIFYQTKWDDGARLFINGVTIVDDFTAEWDKPTRFGKIFLERGQRYSIEAQHRENVGGQQAILEYEVPSAGVGRQVVPKSQLFPAP
ncbi:PA14 domain-containing protein [Pedobacter sp. HMWF019]|uniref:PA14 domain-containing protein n=1 Tax=Pedobacter sp. HMWF019 TaxID=2056856 RepID=UPI0013048B5F|nr:PA14 domain-containing protein [Pedobacter sp. HMWF019]